MIEMRKTIRIIKEIRNQMTRRRKERVVEANQSLYQVLLKKLAWAVVEELSDP
jgi:hypothetical protein